MNEIDFYVRVRIRAENEAVAEDVLMRSMEDVPAEIHIEKVHTVSVASPRKDDDR